MTAPSSSSKIAACAACRHHRKRCAPDCPLAPFFPAHRQKEFRNAHKLFGVSNILKLLEKLTPQQKNEAITSIIYEANARAADPVRGCVSWIPMLLQKIKQVETELYFVTQQLDFYRKKGVIGEMGMSSSDFWGLDLQNPVAGFPIQPQDRDGLQYFDWGCNEHQVFDGIPVVKLEREESSSSLLIDANGNGNGNEPQQPQPSLFAQINDQQPSKLGNGNFGAGFDEGNSQILAEYTKS